MTGGKAALQWVEIPWSNVQVLDDPPTQLVAYARELRKRLRLRDGHKRGRKRGSGAYPDAPSLLAKLLPIYRWLKGQGLGAPSMQACVNCNDCRDDQGQPIYLGITRRHLRTLRSDYGIGWPPE